MPLDQLAKDFADRMNAGLKEEKRKDLATADRQVPLVEQYLLLLATEKAALKAAKETMDPNAIRQAAMKLDRVRIQLMLSRDWLRRGIAQTPENLADLQAAEQRASAPIAEIADEVAHARSQADHLARAQGGPLAQLPQATAPATPDETRKLASEVAPLGLCDDPQMHSPTSHACPLSPDQRDATREEVNLSLEAIASSWRDAAMSEQLKLRLEPLFQKSGINPLLDLLLSIATGWLTSQVGALFLKSVNNARSSLTQRYDPDLSAMTGLEGPFGGAPALGPKSGALVSGIGSNLAAKTLGVFKNPGPSDTPQVLFDEINQAAITWGHQARQETRQLPDPVLVGLAKGLQSAQFGPGYFRTRIEQLIEQFRHVDTIGAVTMKDSQPLLPIWVVSPTGGLRLALARRDTTMVPVQAHPGPSHEPEDNDRERATGQWVFDSWVDRSLYPVALAHDASPITLAAYDWRWKNAPSHATDPGDIRIAPDRKESTAP